MSMRSASPGFSHKILNKNTLENTLNISPWCIFRNNIAVGETATINSNQFLLGLETFSIDGTLDNNGRMLVL